MCSEATACLGRAGRAGAKSSAAKVQYAQRDFQSLTQGAEDVFSRHWHISKSQPTGRRATNAELFHAREGPDPGPAIAEHNFGFEIAVQLHRLRSEQVPVLKEARPQHVRSNRIPEFAGF